jgi:predicted HTH domain antitoxin
LEHNDLRRLLVCVLRIDIPDERLSSLNVPADRAADELRMLAAVKLFELGRLSSGAAAEFAGIPKPLFLQRLAQYGVTTFNMTPEEFDQETRLG